MALRRVQAFRRAHGAGLVWLGGTLGTGARYSLTQAFPPRSGWPLSVLGINLLGAFLLAVLVQTLSARTDSARSRAVRLALGTGMLGGFTTYSALAVDTLLLGGGGHPGAAIGYALATVVGGGLASWLGIGLAARRGSPA